MKNKEIIEKKESKKDYDTLISPIGYALGEARKRAYMQVNQILVKTYWQIGKKIVDYEQKGKIRADYGSELMKILSSELSTKLGKGFSRSNLQNMRLFYLQYPKSQTLSGKLSWSHYCLLLGIRNTMPNSTLHVSGNMM